MKTPGSRPQTPLATVSSLPVARGSQAIVTAKQAHFGARDVNLVPPHVVI